MLTALLFTDSRFPLPLVCLSDGGDARGSGGGQSKSKRDEDSSTVVTVSGKSVMLLACSAKGRQIKWTKGNTDRWPHKSNSGPRFLSLCPSV